MNKQLIYFLTYFLLLLSPIKSNERIEYLKSNLSSISIWHKLKQSIVEDDLDVFNYLISIKPEYINKQDKLGMSLLMISSVEGKIKIAARLLELGAKIHLINDYQMYPTALDLAKLNNHKQIIELLSRCSSIRE